MQKKHIVFITHWYPNPSDVQNGVFIQKTAQAVAQQYTVTVLFLQSINQLGQPLVSHESHEGINTIQIQFPKLDFFALQKQKKKTIHYQLNQLHKKDKINVIHYQNLSFDARISQKWAKTHQVPWIASVHWSGFADQRFGKFSFAKKWALKKLAKNADAIVPVSHFLKNKMIDYGIHAKYQVIGNVVDIISSESKRRIPFTFLVLADLDDEIKRISGVIDAFKNHHLIYPEHELLIIGDGPDRDKLMEMADQHPKITFLGRKPQKEAVKIMSTCHATIINSRVETFSIVALESLALGCYTISTPCGGPQEIGQNTPIRILPDFSEESLIQEMTNAFVDYSFSGMPSPIDISLYTSEKISKDWKNLYNDLLKVH